MFAAILRIFVSLALAGPGWAAVTGEVHGRVNDSSGAAVVRANLTATSVAQGVRTTTSTDARGEYSFPVLPVGAYDILCEAPAFGSEKRTGISVDTNSSIELDITLQLDRRSETVIISDKSAELHVEAASTQLGDVVSSREILAVALNGRSFTDLLALQPGVVPVTTQLPDSIVMAGASVAIPPSGALNPGNQSIGGQREDSNGYMVNGGDVKEMMNGGTAIVPNLDSIAEFRILTDNFDAEFGNYSGGVVNVVTKAGTNKLHGSGFGFLRNTRLDARNFFSPERSFYRQNQFGGTAGGPAIREKLFLFGDYQGTRQSQGVDTGLIPVPSIANRQGDLSKQAASLDGEVSGPYLANLLTQKLGYGVRTNEPYYTVGCATNVDCVFPGGVIPRTVWSEPAKHLLPFIPLPNSGDTTFSSAANGKVLRDHKGSFRLDGIMSGPGLLTAYYFLDDYTLNNPYPTGQGGASVPGFAALNTGRSQLLSLGNTKSFGSRTVNEVRLSYMRSANNVGQPSGGVGPSLASQGFVTGPGTPGIVPLAPSIEGIENTVFNSFAIGVPITNLKQANNTYSLSDTFTRVMGPHTLKAGIQFSREQVNVDPNPTLNGSFLFAGTETGSDFADFLIGVASNYNQADSQAYYGRHGYAAAFAQDSWRVARGLTMSLGLRWDLMEYWSEKYNQIPTFVLGQQSEVFPGAPAGLVYPTDRGIPNTLVPTKNRFAPRLGIAWAPSERTSIRAGYGIFQSAIQGNTIAIDEPQPPYGLSYTSPAPPLFATPFISAADGTTHVQPFPIAFPPLNASVSNPGLGLDFSSFLPQAGMTTPYHGNTYPYSESYFFAVDRKLRENTLLRVSYVGSQAHHLLLVYSANPGNPQLCLALSRPAAVAPGSATCGPFAEDAVYTSASGQTFNGTRGPFGPQFSNNDFEGSFGNSNYNSLQASVRHSGRMDLSVAYTFSKSIDQASSISDIVDPFNYSRTRALSAWDLKHNLVATFDYPVVLPLKSRLGRAIASGWELSGIARMSSGFPVTLSIDGDNSLQGSIPNGVNNHSLDLPDIAPGPLSLNRDPRGGGEYFNKSLFTANALGTPGSASRRSFYGPGTVNFDLALLRRIALSDTKALQFRLETFNTFNHAQFFGPAAVNGDFDSDLFGRVVKASPPRLVQLAVKLTF